MYLRRCGKSKANQEHVYWQLVESVRTERGPRQRTVAYLGNTPETSRAGVEWAAEERSSVWQRQLFSEDLEPDWQRIDTRRVRVERTRDFGASWLSLEVLELIGLPAFLEKIVPPGREEVPWSVMALVLVICRLCSPSSELRIAECLYERSALEDLLGLPAEKVNDDRLYRSLDALIKHKAGLEVHLKERLGSLFDLSYDLLLYDVTSTYIEGEGSKNEQMLRGYSRDQRPDCKQVCIALVVSRCGMPLGYEVFEGNRLDVTTVKSIVTLIEGRYGKADRIWVMDRGMASEDNLEFLREGERRYIIGTPRADLKKVEKELIKDNWLTVRDGLEVKLCNIDEGKEIFILCRSRDRKAKEHAIHEKFEKRIEEALDRMVKSCEKRKLKAATLNRRIGTLFSKNSRAKRLFKVDVRPRDDGGSDIVWEKISANQEWFELTEGCYLLRTNVTDWTAEELWKAYVQLTEAENAFRIQKSDLQLRPIWHQKKERAQAHILVCFLAFVVWKTIGQICKKAGLGDEPRQVFDEIAQIKMVDVVLHTTNGQPIRRRCIAEPTKAQKVLLDRLKLRLPKQLKLQQM
jgi:transposase